MKFVPVSVMVKPAPPASAEVGTIEERVGTGLLLVMVKVCADDCPPPGGELPTVTDAVPIETMSAAGTEAVREVALTKVVVSAALFQRTAELLTKFVPVTVSVNVAPPASPEVGAIEVSVGAGLLTVKVPLLSEAPPPGPGLLTRTVTVAPAAMSEAGTVALNDVALTKVVASGAPFHSTTVPFTKLKPVTVIVKLLSRLRLPKSALPR